MGLSARPLLKRLQSLQSSADSDGDGYPPSTTTPSDISDLGEYDDDDADTSTSHVGGVQDPNSMPARSKTEEPSLTTKSQQATHDPNDAVSNPAFGSSNKQPGTSLVPGIPGVSEDPERSVEKPDYGHTTSALTDPTQIGDGPVSDAATASMATTTTTTSSVEDPTAVSEGVAASGGSGSGADGKKVAAIAVPVVVICVALVVGLFFFAWRRRKNQLAQPTRYNIETTNPGMAEINRTDGSPTHIAPPPLPPVNTIPTMRYDSPETSPQEPIPPQILDNDDDDDNNNNTTTTTNNNQRLSAISVQLQRAQQQPTVVTTRPQSYIPPKTVQHEQGPTALTQENLASLGDTPQGYSFQRPRSPFEHPDDDLVSAISALSPGGNDPRFHGRDADEISAVSSLDHADMPPRRPLE